MSNSDRATVDVDDLAVLAECSFRQARRLARKFDCFEEPGHRSRGGKVLRVYVDSLPIELRVKWEVDILRLDDADEKEVMARAEILIGVERLLKGLKNGGVKRATTEYCRERGITYRTYRYWYNAFQDSGLRGLLFEKNNPIVPVPAEVRNFIISEYCRPQQPVVARVAEACESFCEKKGYEVLTRYKVQTIINEIPPEVVVRAREGSTAWKDGLGYYTECDWSKVGVNEVWCGDHRQFDVLVYRNGNVDRPLAPWISCWEDMRSRKITGWFLNWGPNSDTVALSLRDGILRCGKPDMLLIDNGKDYVSRYFTERKSTRFKVDLNKSTRIAITSKLNIKVTNALPYNHKRKPIESLFKFMALRFDREQPGWRGPDTASKPEKLAHEIENKLLLSDDEFFGLVEEWIDEYNDRVHSETRRTPDSFYKNARVKAVAVDELDFVLFKERKTKIRRRGVRLHGLWFISADMYKHVGSGDPVTIRYNPHNLSEVILLSRDGHFLCKLPQAEKRDPINMSEREWLEEKRIHKAQRERLREATKFLRDAKVKKSSKKDSRSNTVVDGKPVSSDSKMPAAVPAPVYSLATQIIGRDGILARQVAEADAQREDARRTGTDDLVLFGLQAPPEEKKKPILLMERFKKNGGQE